VSFVADLHRRFATLIAELTKFGLVGTLGLILDVGGANLLHGGFGLGPLLSKAISATVATVASYAGHRLWTFRHRANQGVVRGWVIFFGLNLVGLLVSLVVISITTNVLQLHGLAAYNVAQGVGVLLGMLFRYWSYRRWVFLAFEPPEQTAGAANPVTGNPAGQVPGSGATASLEAGRPQPGPAQNGRAQPARRWNGTPAVLKPDR
jgi:putative flippase GtrA